MKRASIETLDYEPGDEERIVRLLAARRDPLLLRFSALRDTFDLDFFRGAHESDSSFYEYDPEGNLVRHDREKFSAIIDRIKADQPVRIFGEFVADELNDAVLDAIPLWRKLDVRPRYFRDDTRKPFYFFGGRGSFTRLHYDHELNDILHVCLHGRKKVMLFKGHEGRNLYKIPFYGECLVDLRRPLDECLANYPLLKHATCYEVEMRSGDMLYLPKRCWHHIEYLESNASATLAFYPRKIDQIWGSVLGVFYLGFTEESLSLNQSDWFRRFAYGYAHAQGLKRPLYALAEWILFAALWPACAAGLAYTLHSRGRLY